MDNFPVFWFLVCVVIFLIPIVWSATRTHGSMPLCCPQCGHGQFKKVWRGGGVRNYAFRIPRLYFQMP